jgi:Mrp family chromosome partitioning ATPase
MSIEAAGAYYCCSSSSSFPKTCIARYSCTAPLYSLSGLAHHLFAGQLKEELPPKCVIIMRGLPGAGKSTKAEQLAAEARQKGATVAIHSTDSYFTDPITGAYRCV